MAEQPEVTKEQEPIEKIDLRAEMAEAYDAVEQPEAAPDAPAAEKPATEAAPRPDGRDPKGRFAPKSEPSASSSPQPEGIAVPEDWPADVKAAWPTLPPALQRFAAQRTQEVGAQMASLGEKAQQFEAITRAIPDLPAFVQTHGSLEIGLNRLMSAANWARRDPGGFAKWLIGAANIDPRTLIAAPQQQVDPTLAPLMQRLDGLQNQVQRYEQEQTQQRFQAISSTVEAFAKDHPHLDALQATMADMIEKRFAANLSDAYDKALALNPELRAKDEADKKAAADAEATKAKEAAAKARRHVSTNVRSTGATVEAAPGNDWKSIRGTMKQAYNDANA